MGLGGLVVDVTSPRTAFLIASVGGVLSILVFAPTILRSPAPTPTPTATPTEG
jgi:hypothetical protein